MIFWEMHEDLPQQGPGSDNSTRRALDAVPKLPPEPRILDLGCGPGRQTLCVVRHTDGRAVALDNHRPFLRVLSNQAEMQKLDEQIRAVCGSMEALCFAPQSFDLIWSEGAIYIIGFERGLRTWSRYLKPGGFMAVTECSWLRGDPPAELAEFWREAYPGMRSREENVAIVNNSGYNLINSFVLPVSDWWDCYYAPLQERAEKLRNKYRGDKQALDEIGAEEAEIEIFRKYSAYYGYVFYVMQKADS